MIGKTPIDLGNLTYGRHQIDIKSPGYVPSSIQVTVLEGAPVILSLDLLKNPSPTPLSPFTVLTGILITGAFALIWRRI